VKNWLRSVRIIYGRLRKNRLAVAGFWIIVALVSTAIFAPWIAPYDPNEQDLLASLEGPSLAHPMGVDFFGRDVLSRVIWGTRVSLTIALMAVAISAIVGTLLGSLAGFYGGVLDEVIMRIMDIFLAIPSILLAIAIVAALGPRTSNLVFAVSLSTIPEFARIARSAVLVEKNKEYIEAARAIGESRPSMLFRYALPNSMVPMVVQASLRMATAILSVSGLGFLGLGVQPPTPEWGTDLSLARTYLEIAPHAGIFPGIAIFLSVIGFNFLGDGLNEALNPRLKDR